MQISHGHDARNGTEVFAVPCPGFLVGVSESKPLVYTSPAEPRLLFSRRGRWIFNSLWGDLHPLSLVGAERVA